jgi:2,4-dienoyl-CoA reductase-like NADH-dependent reductase (Old Yellow Enzyme family)
MAPMTHSSSNADGTVSEAELRYYARRAGSVGMVITGSAAVMSNGGFPGQASVDRDELISGLSLLASTIRDKGAKAILQIAHGGRKCPPFIKDIVSASPVPERAGAVVPRELTEAEIWAVVRAFGEATRRAIEAGFDGVEIHGANGFLIQQFFSPNANQRNDKWGGTLEKRMAFPLEIVREVQRVASLHAKKPFLIGYRLTPEEAETPGITMADTLALVEAIAAEKLHYIHVSQNDFWSVPLQGTGSPRTRLEIIQECVRHIPVIGAGSIRTAEDAVRALQSGIPLIALGREIVMEPDWLEKIVEGRENDIKTTLSIYDQHRLAIPDPLWSTIMRVPGWFPVEADGRK